MYYVAINNYSTETSIGFYNTWYVLGFATKSARDAHVQNCPKLATKAIKASEIKKYGGKHGQNNYIDLDGNFFQHMGRGNFALIGPIAEIRL